MLSRAQTDRAVWDVRKAATHTLRPSLRRLVLPASVLMMLTCLLPTAHLATTPAAAQETLAAYADVLGNGQPIQVGKGKLRNVGSNSTTVENTVHIFFGSCNRHDRDQGIWDAIYQKMQYDFPGSVWVWLGDVIYADNLQFPSVTFRASEEEEIRRRFRLQRQSPRYAALADTVPIMGVWDDHDFGINDGDRGFPQKRLTQQVFLDFLDIPPHAPIRKQEGLYSYQRILSPDGKRSVLLILLDNRYHKAPYGEPGEREGDFLGEKQWAWLAETLANVPSDVTLIGGGVQFIAATKPTEHWSRFPGAYERLLSVIGASRRAGVMLLSGDIHFSELHVLPCPGHGISYPLYDLTSSGLTHAVPGFLSILEYYLYTSTLKASYYGKNFGHVAVDFEGMFIALRVYDTDGYARVRYTIPFSELLVGTSAAATAGALPRECPPYIISPAAWLMLRLVRVLERSCNFCGLSPSGFHISIAVLSFIIGLSVYLAWKLARILKQAIIKLGILSVKCAALMSHRQAGQKLHKP